MMKYRSEYATLLEGSPAPEARLTGKKKADLAIRLLREMAQYDPAMAERMREVGLEPETPIESDPPMAD